MFVLQTDASDVGLGAVLTQEVEGEEHVVAYASRSLQKAERNYSATEKECLAVVWGIQKMRPYLEGYRFKIITDHFSLKWLRTLENPSGRLARWSVALQQFDFEVEYRKGALNHVPDALSRQPLTQEAEALSPLANAAPNARCPWHEGMLDRVQREPAKYADYRVQDGRLYRHLHERYSLEDHEDAAAWKLCLPRPLRGRALQECHDEATAGHLGIAKTICRLARSYYWPGMMREAAGYVRRCRVCRAYKPEQRQPAGHLRHRTVHEPADTISVDIVGPLPRTARGYTSLIVLQDTFSKWLEVRPMRQATASAVCTATEDVVFRLGCPRRLITDNGRQFISREFQELMRKLGIQHQYTPPYSPQCNPVERGNKTIKTMIAQFTGNDHRKWDQKLTELTFAVNTAVHESTGYTPAYLMYGRELVTPGSLRSQCEEAAEEADEAPEINRRIERIEKLREAFKVAELRQQEATARQARYYNLRRRDWRPAAGETVWRRERPLSNAMENFAAKLAPKYSGPYVVQKFLSPVIVLLKKENKVVGPAHVKDLKSEGAREDEEINIATPVVAHQCAFQATSVDMEQQRDKPRVLSAEAVRERVRRRQAEARSRKRSAERNRAQVMRELFGELSCSDDDPPTATRASPRYTIPAECTARPVPP